MTAQSALDRATRLLALAAPRSGATDEERRTAAAQAARIMAEHGFVPAPAGESSTPRSVVSVSEVAKLALRVVELEHELAATNEQHRRDLRDVEAGWRQLVEDVRHEERAGAYAARKSASRTAVVRERTEMARQGGRARDASLTSEQKIEIAKAAAQARWSRWREQHQR